MILTTGGYEADQKTLQNHVNIDMYHQRKVNRLTELVERCQKVAPVVAFLCHESCKETGLLIEAGGGCVSQIRWQRSAASPTAGRSWCSHQSTQPNSAMPDGPLSGPDGDELRVMMSDLIKTNLGRVVLDASEIPTIDSPGLESLVDIAQELGQSGKSLKICALHETLQQVLDLTGLAPQFASVTKQPLETWQIGGR